MATDLITVNIEDEMRKSYLDYAMSVIVGRALPDVRDGLKPVHRRILYAMHEMANHHDKPYKKSARIVGDVIGKYHPHGDSAVYDAIVRMVQDFSMREPLIDGQGNFGSVDGDNAAAMRYTEIRLRRIAAEVLADIDKETVDWAPNYDESLLEPEVLPSKVPNLLLNGSAGIAVGMATNIPPHNLGELCHGLLALLANPHIELRELMTHIPGPDFPTGAFIYGTIGIQEAYFGGRGSITMRARTHIETDKNGRETIVVTELPYMVNKARLIEKIAELVKDKKLEGVSDLRDESDREGMRMVVMVKRNEPAEVVLNRLFKMTAMQSTFGVNAVALVHGQPRLLNLKQMLQAFLDHREETVLRRTRFELKKARERAHILEGLVKALDHLDAVIELIRASRDPDDAKAGLMARFEFSEVQAKAILDMRLQRLTGLERDKIVAEYQEVLARIAELEAILADRAKVLQVIADELRELQATFGSPRRSEIVPVAEDLELEDLIADDEFVIMRTARGYLKRVSLAEFREQRRGGKGKAGIETREEDWVDELFVARARDYLLAFTDLGRLFWLKAWRIPETGRTAKGTPAVNLVELAGDEKIATLLQVREFRTDESLMFFTEQGVVKRTPLKDYAPESEQGRRRSGGLNAIELETGDHLVAVRPVRDGDEVLIVSRRAQSIRFPVADVRAMGRGAVGVYGLRLDAGDAVVQGLRLKAGTDVLTVSGRGFGKRTAVDEYRLQGRGGKGILTMRLTDKTGNLVAALPVSGDDGLILATDTGRVARIDVGSIREAGRSTQGVILMKLAEGETIAGVARVDREDGGSDMPEGSEGAPQS